MIKTSHLLLTIVLSFVFTSCSSKPLSQPSSYNGYYGTPDPYYNYHTPPHSPAPALTPYNSGTRDALGHRAGPSKFSTVIIDPGHGGRDPGAVVNGVTEKSLAMDVAKRLRNELSSKFRVIFIRNGDYYVDLDSRVRATKPYSDAILVSIHLNHGSKSYLRGPETYYFRVDSYSLAKRLQRNMAAVSPAEASRGLVRRRLRLTRNPEIPSVLLELGYLSNSSDRALLASSSYRQKMASAIAKAIKDQNAYGDTGMGSLPTPLNRPLSRPNDRSEL